jgi:SulP family sulfate permease
MRAVQRPKFRVPAWQWLREYPLDQLPGDLLAGLITAVLLVPQGLAYASLAGLPAEVGLYAGILPALVYALLGSSRVLSVGPVSIAALLVANALATAGSEPNSANYLHDALLLAALTGSVLILMALLRLEFLMHFVGHPVLSGFTSGAALLIILSQLKPLTGIPATLAEGSDLLAASTQWIQSIDWLTALLASATIVLLILSRSPCARLLAHLGVGDKLADLLSRAGTVVVLVILIALVAWLDLAERGVDIVGLIPAGLPSITLDFWRMERALELLPSALLIALIGYIESVSIAKVLAYRRRQTIDNNQEFMALGVANLAAAISGGMPVAGGFSRSVVNYDAGARSQVAGFVTALLVALIVAVFAHWFYYLPKAALAAVIVVAVFPLLDWRTAVHAFKFDKGDGAALIATFFGVVLVGIEVGLIVGVAVAVGAFMWRASKPHIAVLGRLPGTAHYRNVARYQTETWPELLLIRVDRSLVFANFGYVETYIHAEIAKREGVRHVVLSCSGVNGIDFSALEALERLVQSLEREGITMHFADVKGPIFHQLERAGFWQKLGPGHLFASTDEAVNALVAPDVQLYDTGGGI